MDMIWFIVCYIQGTARGGREGEDKGGILREGFGRVERTSRCVSLDCRGTRGPFAFAFAFACMHPLYYNTTAFTFHICRCMYIYSEVTEKELTACGGDFIFILSCIYAFVFMVWSFNFFFLHVELKEFPRSQWHT